MLGAPELDAGLQVGSEESGVKGQNLLPQPAGHNPQMLPPERKVTQINDLSDGTESLELLSEIFLTSP